MVVDVVAAYIEPGSPLFAPGFVAALEPNRCLVAAARAAGVPVIFTRVVYDAQGRDGGLFFGTSLASTLRAGGIDTVLITGFSTSGCVRATALDALQNGFAPFVVREACGERDVRPQEANLFDLQAKYAEVVSLERALQDIARNGRAAGPR